MAMFNTLDTNQSGTVTIDELLSGMNPILKAITPNPNPESN